MKHKHADLIIAWANGAPIQWKDRHGQWEDMGEPLWAENHEYRIKPEPKPDIIKFINVRLQYKDTGICRWDSCDASYANLKLVFDGETGELKSAEVLSRGQE